MRLFPLFLLLYLIPVIVSGQIPGARQTDLLTVKGRVLNAADNTPLDYATIAFYNKSDSTVAGGGLSDTGGYFEFQVPQGDLFAKIEFISYATITIDPVPTPEGGRILDLGNILLEPESEIIENVEILAERSETTFALDKKVFTVGKDLANRGGTAEDILDNVPSVTVDIEGNVSLRGSDAVRILINGRPSGLAGAGNANGLRSLAANMIEKVEVITNPSARYEAEGSAGIINIVLKKIDNYGFNGTVEANGGYPERWGASANLNYRQEKFNWFINYGVNYRSGPGGGRTVQDQLLSDDSLATDMRQISVQKRDQNRTGLSNSIRFGADYYFSDKEYLTGAFLYRKSDEDNLSVIEYKDYLAPRSDFEITEFWTRDIEFLKSYDYDNVEEEIPSELLSSVTERTDDEKEDETDLEYSLNYTKEFSSREHALTASIQFSEESEVESSLFNNQDLLNNSTQLLQRSENAEGEENWYIKADYVHPLGEDHKWETGVLASLQEITNDFIVEDNIDDEWVPVEGLNNNFIYDEEVYASYFIYGNTLGKFSFQGGLRGEYAFIHTRLEQAENPENDRDFFNLFPSGTLNYNFSEKSALQLSYSRRIRRPRFWDLNPFFTFSDDRNFFSGNPDINPQYTNSYELGQLQYWQDLTLSGSFFYRRTDASIQRIISVDNENATTLRVPLNIGTENDYGLDLSLSFSGVDWLRIDGNWNIFRNVLLVNEQETEDAVYNYYKNVRNFSEGRDAFNSRYDYALNETDNIIWNGRLTTRFTFWNSDLQLRANYRGPRQTSQGRDKASGSLDVGWSRDFLDNRLTVTLSVRDLLNTRRRNGFTILPDFFQKSDFQWRARYTTINLSYRINQKKDKRSRRDGMDEEGFEGGDF